MVPAEMTPAEIAALERRIAEGVMGWIERDGSWWSKGSLDYSIHEHYMIDWSPWHNPADALEVLERLAKGGPYWIQRVDSKTFEVGLGFPSEESGAWAESPGDHYGPAVCRLAQMVMENSK